MTYASGTTVNVAASQQEIAKTLHRYHVDTYSFGARPGMAMVEFALRDLPIRVAVPLPEKPAKQRGTNPATGRVVDLWARWEQEVKECWRALLLLIKANLEAVDRGIIRAEQAFMAFLIAPNGQTVGEIVLPQFLESGRLMIEGPA
jgi:hypothetical protein